MKVDLQALRGMNLRHLNVRDLRERFRPRSVLAVTVESGRIAVEVRRREGGEAPPGQSFELAMGAEAVVSAPEKIGKELAAQLASRGIREREAVVCVPASWALSATTEIPEMTGDDLRGYLELKAEREFPIAAAELRLAHSLFLGADGAARATIAAVPAKRLEAVENMIAAAGCRAVSISLGLDACLAPDEPRAALHFVANGTHVDLVIAAGGGIAAVRSLPGPANNDHFSAADFSREVRITLGRLPDALRQQVRQARYSGSPATAETLCLEIRQHLTRLGIESRVLRPGGGAEHPGAARAAAELHLRREAIAFEYLAPRIDRWEQVARQFDDPRRRSAAIAAAALVLSLVVTYLVRSQLESSLTAEWAGMRSKVSELESLQARIRQFRPWFETAPQNLQILESIAAAFPDTGDVWAKNVQINDGSKVACSGFARSQSALLALLDRLRARKDVTSLQVQQVRGESPIQFSITFKLGSHESAR